jgi:hypothetical protein
VTEVVEIDMTGEQTDKQPANLQTKLVDSLESDL